MRFIGTYDGLNRFDGRNLINFYSKELDTLIKDNLRLEGKLLKAINENKLEIPLYIHIHIFATP